MLTVAQYEVIRRKVLVDGMSQRAVAQELGHSRETKGVSVATDILGVSGRDMLTRLMHGERDVEVLAELARGRLRKKIPQLKAGVARTSDEDD